MKETIGHVVGLLENNQKRKREGYRALLSSLHTVTGMLVLGAILLAVPVVFFAVTNLQQEETTNNVIIGIDNGGMVIEMHGSDGSVVITEDFFGSGEEDDAWSAAKDLLRKDAERKHSRNRTNAIICGVCGAGCFVYAFVLWKKKKKDEEKDKNAGTFAAETTSIEKETEEEINMPVETSAPDNGRQENLKRLYEAGILSREEYLARKKKR